MTTKPTVTVLLSSYNGAKYIEAQIESILAQEGVQLQLVVRDDGSSDSTPEILRRLAARHDNMAVFTRENVGFVRSFFDLMKNAGGSDFYAFSDQDDVWLPNKLSVAAAKLCQFDQDEPLMYFSAVEYVDMALNHLAHSPAYELEKIGFGNALVQNVAIGCTIVVNETTRRLVVSKLPQKCQFHDWWVYLVVSAFGKVVFDPSPGIKYRQHGGNVVGAAMSLRDVIKRRVRRFVRYSKATKTSTQIEEFYALFGDRLNEEQRLTVQRILDMNSSMLARLMFVFGNDYWRQSLADQLLLRMVILSGRF